MKDYFAKDKAMAARVGTNTKEVIEIIAEKFMKYNKKRGVSYHVISKDAFKTSSDYMDEIKIHESFPDMKNETYAYAWTTLNAVEKGDFHFRIRVYGPVFVYINGKLGFRSGLYEERFSDSIVDMCLDLEKGLNHLVFLCIKTPLGCGFCIGSSSYKGRRIQFFAPEFYGAGMAGFIYSGPLEEPLKGFPENICKPESTCKSENTYNPENTCKPENICNPERSYSPEIKWYPVVAWNEEEMKLTPKQRIFPGQSGIIVTRDAKDLCIPGVDNIYAGPFKEETIPNAMMNTLEKPFETINGMDYWHVDQKNCMLRPYNEGTKFGEWNYPLGVTIYGLLQTGRLIHSKKINNYVREHLKKTTVFFEYCMWDKQQYGAAPFHNQLTTIDSLDDCGSFGSAMLEFMKEEDLKDGVFIADYIADYIRNKQQRLEDGTFYRNNSYQKIMNETMWADDMYMSTPFLCRYYQHSQDVSYLEDAIHQAISFDHYLYMPECEVYSHIYDTHYKLQTKVPWGRGNGWAAFSLTELLAVMETTHPLYHKVLEIYQKLCKGYLKLQGDEGMWHQVLTMPESYLETSCTAMFIYAFARGVRYGWLKDSQSYVDAVHKGWDGLCRIAIDEVGNVYGVCRGSGYSFSKEYYANDLTWNLNDTHGIGIVMLAGIEVERMENKMQ